MAPYCYNGYIDNHSASIAQLVARLREKGGKINKYYLQDWNRKKTTLVYLNGWFTGRTVREAILKALLG